MPKLWDETIEAHRREVREAVLDAAAELAAERGLLSVTMSRVAEGAGIGRATLYNYFPDVEAILLAWHERQIAGHLEQLCALRDDAGDPRDQLEAVLEAYAHMSRGRSSHERPGPEVAAALHRGVHVARAQEHVHELFRSLLAGAVATGDVRGDIAPGELATYCLHALGAAADLSSRAAVRRLVEVTLDGLRPPE